MRRGTRLTIRDQRNRLARVPRWRRQLARELADPASGTAPAPLAAALQGWCDRAPLPAHLTAVLAEVERQRRLLVADDRRFRADGRPIGEIALHGSNPVAVCDLLVRVADAVVPTKALELGTLLGQSAAYLAAALPAGGRLVTVDFNGDYVERARQFLTDCGLADRVEAVCADFNRAADGPLAEDGYDLLYKDGSHNYDATIGFFRRCREWAAPGATLLFDDLDRPELQAAWQQIDAELAPVFRCSTGRTGIAVLP